MTNRTLFFMRLLDDWKFQWGVVHSVLDWTIMIYIVVPFLMTASMYYADLWRHTNHYWHSTIPLSFLLGLILLISNRGNFRTYLKEADLLHLIQHKNLIYGLKRWGFIASSMLVLIESFIIVVFSMPILILVYGMTNSKVFCLGLSIVAYRMVVLTIKKVEQNVIKWALFIVAYFGAILLVSKTVNLFLVILSLLIILVITCFFCQRLLKTNEGFLKEISIEDKERMKYIKIIFKFSMAIEKEKRYISTKPFLVFRNSRRLFKRRNPINGFTEIIIKSFLRNRSHVASYFQMLFITSAAIIVLPIWIKCVVFLIFTIFINSWLKAVVNKMVSNDFFSVISVNKEIINASAVKSRRLFSLPIITCIGLILIFSLICA